MANLYRKDALLKELGMNETDDAPQQIQPVGPRLETPAAPAIEAPAAAATPVAPAAPQHHTKLMEGDPAKLASAAHALKSPKYAFLQAANTGQYGYQDLGKMLSDLQANPNSAKFFQGWSADKDKLKFGGDPATLDPAWKGVREVDAIGAFNSGNPTGWRWGADDAGAMAAGAGSGAASLDSRLTGDPTAAIQEALSKLGSSANLQALLAQLGQVA